MAIVIIAILAYLFGFASGLATAIILAEEEWKN